MKMPKIVAFAGKGGVGKTTVSGILVRYLVEQAVGPILAVDADPNSNLNEVLGIEVRTTIGDAREQMKKDVPVGMTKETWFEYKVHEAVIEGKGYDLLVMGRPEGPGCYCAANSLAKKHIDVLKENYEWVVVDNEAGMEHMSRLVTQDVDHLYVVSDPGPRGILTARRIVELIGELRLNVGETHVILNRVTPDAEREVPGLAAAKGVTIDGMVREDRQLAKADAEGLSIFSLDGGSPAVADAYAVFRKTLSDGHKS